MIIIMYNLIDFDIIAWNYKIVGLSVINVASLSNLIIQLFVVRVQSFSYYNLLQYKKRHFMFLISVL